MVLLQVPQAGTSQCFQQQGTGDQSLAQLLPFRWTWNDILCRIRYPDAVLVGTILAKANGNGWFHFVVSKSATSPKHK